jgi:hypothetical protein
VVVSEGEDDMVPAIVRNWDGSDGEDFFSGSKVPTELHKPLVDFQDSVVVFPKRIEQSTSSAKCLEF